MVEQIFKMTTGPGKVVEKIIMDENLNLVHMIFEKGEGLPEHISNSNVYMTIIKGELTIALNDEEPNSYAMGTILKIPINTKMNVKNQLENALEMLVVKAPAPGIKI